MPDAVIVSTARTPIGKAYRGAFNMTHGATLGGHVVAHAVKRAGIDPAEVDDVVMGCAMPERATGHNIARLSAIRAGLPASVGGMTINRFCSSGLQTIAVAAQRIIAGEADVIVAGGLESISLVQDGREFGARGLADGAQAGSVDADDRDRRHRGAALRREPRRAGRLCAGKPAPHRGRAAGRPLCGRDRAAADDQEGGRQEYQGRESRAGHAQERRMQPARYDARRSRDTQAGARAAATSRPAMRASSPTAHPRAC